MKWIVGFFLGLAISVFTFFILLLTPLYEVLGDITTRYLCSTNGGCGDSWIFLPFISALIIAIIVGVAGFAVAVWQLGKRGIGKGTYILKAILFIALFLFFLVYASGVRSL